MSIRHHPSAELRSDYVAASLAPGAAMSVAAHLKVCPVCAVAVETMSGAHAGASRPSVAARSERSFGAPPPPPQPPPEPVRETPAVETADWRTGPWRFMAPGVRIAALRGVGGLGEGVHLVKARRGARLGLAGGLQHVLVLEGGFAEGQAYEAGDFLDYGEGKDLPRAPRAGRGGCVLLVVSDDSWPASRFLRFRLAHGGSGPG